MSAPSSSPYPGVVDDVEQEEKVEVLSLLDGNAALSAVDRASIDIQIATAKAHPRSITTCLKDAIQLATLDEATATSMLYSLKRGSKIIPGPSVRLAEVMLYAWTNIRADADIVAEDRTFVTAMGTCFDLEKNVAVRIRVKRRITDKNGVRYNDDMIGVTCNAAISIALRNAVFKVIPRTLVDRVYGFAKTASLGKGGTMTEKRQKAVDWFAKMAVKPAQVFALLGVAGMDDIGEDELVTLRGLANAIKEGEMSIESVFFPATGATSDGAHELNQALHAAPAPAAAAAKKPTTTASTPEAAP